MKRNQVFSIHNLTMMAALTAIQIILARYLSIQSEMFRFSFETIPLALAGLWLGPVPAMLVALVSDIIGFSLAGIGVYFPPLTAGPVIFALICGLASRYWLGDGVADMKNSWKVFLVTIIAGVVNSILVGGIAFTLYQIYVLGTEGSFMDLLMINFGSRLATKPVTIIGTAVLVTMLNKAVYKPVIQRIVGRA